MADCKKSIQKSLLLIIFGVILLIIALSYHGSQSDSKILFSKSDSYQPKRLTAGIDSTVRRQNASEVLTQNLKKRTKQILYWLGPRMLLPDGEYVCPGVNYTVRFKSAKSYSALSTSDAVILHHTGNWRIEELARYRPPGQMWIYMSRESPPHSGHGRVPNVFNWTITYRPDSDFPIPYGIYENYDSLTKERNLLKSENKNWAKTKTKLAAWIASNCNGPSWPRTSFVRNLSKKMSIDMFGKCGDRSCPGSECYEKLRSYKFYLALENCRCTDYITEKMWRNSFVYDAVPIVYGTNKQNYEKLAPPNSFIHVSDFPNMTSLANYIKLLDRNDSMYNKFMRWKDFSYIDERREDAVITKETLCSIAKKLLSVDKLDEITRSDKTNSVSKKPIITDMKKMWFDTCKESPPLPLP